MKIDKRRISNLSAYLPHLEDGTHIRVVVRSDEVSRELLEKSGLPVPLIAGHSVLPSMIGAVSKFNALGRWDLKKDQPKEDRYINTIEWSWKQWVPGGGTETITDYKDVYRSCFKRELIPPPSVDLAVVELEGVRYITSPVFVIGQDSNLIQHVINLYLEIFRFCEVTGERLEALNPPVVTKVDWEILPQGENPWEAVVREVEQKTRRKHPRYRNVIINRQKVIVDEEPDEIVAGSAGYRGYLAYIFLARNMVILESMEIDNATYVFDKDWQEFSMLSKAEVINNNHHKARIIHSSGWKESVKRLLAEAII